MHVYVYSVNIINFSHYLYTQLTEFGKVICEITPTIKVYIYMLIKELV